MTKRNHPRRNQDLFANIPPEIIIDILSRLPFRTVISCKSVCKTWLALLEKHEFVKLHLLKATPSYIFRSNFYYIFDFEDGLDLEHHDLHYKSVTRFRIPYQGQIFGSANGLLCLRNTGNNVLCILNPITRDCIELDCCCPQEFMYSRFDLVLTYGFGVSKITGQHKVIWILQAHYRGVGPKPANPDCICEVYTIGTGLWRRIPTVSHLGYRRYSSGTLFNGNLHWLVSDFGGPQLAISCLDLETEQFSTLSCPLLKRPLSFEPSVLGGCLCLCNDNLADGVDIWLMKEYGVETSWTKHICIGNASPLDDVNLCDIVINPIKVFKDGDILLAWNQMFLFYSQKNQTVQKVGLFQHHNVFDAFYYTPSFLSLESFGMEDAFSL